VALIKRAAAKAGVDVQIEEIEVTSVEDAVSKCFLGSPTVVVNWVNIDPRARQRTDYGLSCVSTAACLDSRLKTCSLPLCSHKGG
jgi:hypothetical protein